MSTGKVSSFLFSLSTDSYSLLLFEKVSRHHADAGITTITNHEDTLDIDNRDFTMQNDSADRPQIISVSKQV